MSITTDTLDLFKEALQNPSEDVLAKSITTATGLVAYDLQAPAKNLYPVNTPIRNSLPRVPGGVGTATNWVQISNIIGSGYDAMGWVPEGQRTARMSYTSAQKAASYRTLGEEDQVTLEAINAGKGFEDVRATMTMRLIQKLMLKEENAIFGGNATLNLGTVGTVTLSATGSGATLPALTYSVICVALTHEGYRNFIGGGGLTTGLPLGATFTGADGNTYTLNGGTSIKSAAATQAVTLGQILNCSVVPIQGAVAYAWFTGAAASEKLEQVTTSNSATFSAPLNGTYQAAAANFTTDKSSNSSIAYDGLLTTALKSGSGAYVKTLLTAGVGTTLTASGRGSVAEIDTMLQAMWDANQVSPDVIYVNSQQLKDITTKVFTGTGSAPLLQYIEDPGGPGYKATASGVISSYFNPFSTAADGGIKIPIKIHPLVPAGTIFGYCNNLPAQYLSNNVPNVAELKLRADYYEMEFAQTARSRQFGVYAEEVLACYAPFALGVINNIVAG